MVMGTRAAMTTTAGGVVPDQRENVTSSRAGTGSGTHVRSSLLDERMRSMTTDLRALTTDLGRHAWSLAAIALAAERGVLTMIVVDVVGYGTPNAFEGKANAASTSASMAAGGIDVTAGNGYDTDDNATNFVQQAVRVPQNSSSTAEP